MKKKVKTSAVTCGYCLWFYGAVKRHITIDSENRKRPSRFCEKVACMITYTTPHCDLFEKTKYFFCKKDSNFLDITVCYGRSESRKNSCIRCKQGKAIKIVMENESWK